MKKIECPDCEGRGKKFLGFSTNVNSIKETPEEDYYSCGTCGGDKACHLNEAINFHETRTMLNEDDFVNHVTGQPGFRSDDYQPANDQQRWLEWIEGQPDYKPKKYTTTDMLNDIFNPYLGKKNDPYPHC